MEKKNGLAIAALVLAIISAATFWVPFVNVGAMFIALIGLVLGLCALGHPKKTMAIVASALCVVAIVGALLTNSLATKAVNEAIDEFNYELDEAFDEFNEAIDEVAEDAEYD